MPLHEFHFFFLLFCFRVVGLIWFWFASGGWSNFCGVVAYGLRWLWIVERSVVVEGFDVGNFFVIPGTPAKAWEADIVTALHKDNLRVKMGYELEDAVIAIVGSQFMYRGL